MPTQRKNGFTLVEVIAVLLILTILAAVAVSIVLEQDSEEQAQLAVLQNQIRYAQLQSLKHGEVWGLGSDGNDYFLFQGNPGNKKQLPGEKTSIIPEAFVLSFDAFGRPSGDTSISLGSKSFTLSEDTGFIR